MDIDHGVAPGTFTGRRIANIAYMATLTVLRQSGLYRVCKAAVALRRLSHIVSYPDCRYNGLEVIKTNNRRYFFMGSRVSLA